MEGKGKWRIFFILLYQNNLGASLVCYVATLSCPVQYHFQAKRDMTGSRAKKSAHNYLGQYLRHIVAGCTFLSVICKPLHYRWGLEHSPFFPKSKRLYYHRIVHTSNGPVHSHIRHFIKQIMHLKYTHYSFI